MNSKKKVKNVRCMKHINFFIVSEHRTEYIKKIKNNSAEKNDNCIL